MMQFKFSSQCKKYQPLLCLLLCLIRRCNARETEVSAWRSCSLARTALLLDIAHVLVGGNIDSWIGAHSVLYILVPLIVVNVLFLVF